MSQTHKSFSGEQWISTTSKNTTVKEVYHFHTHTRRGMHWPPWNADTCRNKQETVNDESQMLEFFLAIQVGSFTNQIWSEA